MYITADADVYCEMHAKKRYGSTNITIAVAMRRRYDEHTIVENSALFSQYPKDTEGNMIHLHKGTSTYCSDCVYEQVSNKE